MRVERIRKRVKRPEQDIQKALMQVLDIALPTNAIAFAVPNGGGRSKVEAAILRGQGVKAGVPDILVIWMGRVLGLEMKAQTGSLSGSQRALFPRLRDCGMRVEVARSVDEAVEHIKDFGIPMRLKSYSVRQVWKTGDSAP